LTVYPERCAAATPERMAELLEAGNRALAVMEGRLRRADWLAGTWFSIADMAIYTYTHVAHEVVSILRTIRLSAGGWRECVRYQDRSSSIKITDSGNREIYDRVFIVVRLPATQAMIKGVRQ
jgi:glutathione S-transferase